MRLDSGASIDHPILINPASFFVVIPRQPACSRRLSNDIVLPPWR